MKSSTRTLAIAVIPMVMMLSGCVVSVNGEDYDGYNEGWKEAQEDNREAIAQLELGATHPKITRELGEADFSEAMTTEEGEVVKVLFYRTHQVKSDGKTTRDECTPLIFRNGELIGWGEGVYNRIVTSD